MRLGVEQHLLDPHAVTLLFSGPLGHGVPRLGHPVGEVVAQPLELLEAEQPRPARTWYRGGGGPPGPGLGEQTGQLVLQPADLVAQGLPRGALVGRLDGAGWTRRAKRAVRGVAKGERSPPFEAL